MSCRLYSIFAALFVGLGGASAAGLALAKVEPSAVTVGPFDPPLAAEREWTSALRVHVSGGDDLPAVSGEVIAEGNHLRFVPAFPFSPRADYRIEFDHPDLGLLEARFKLASEADAGPLSEVGAVYPSGDILPQNLLKFYIHFSRPMSRGEAYEHVRLLDKKGDIVADPWLELAEELWDADGKRLTLFLDPGRVKRGLKPHEEAGAVLAEGRRYVLEIDAAWKDADRRPMAKSYRKEFQTTAPDYAQPDPKRWDLKFPAAGSMSPLVATFETALDHSLLGRLVEVRTEGGKAVAGDFEIDQNETRWVFSPSEPWRAGSYRLHAGSELEDLAGNSIRKPFEVTPENPGRAVVGPTVSRAFEVE